MQYSRENFPAHSKMSIHRQLLKHAKTFFHVGNYFDFSIQINVRYANFRVDAITYEMAYLNFTNYTKIAN